jgi:hypothetical protein
MSGGVMHEVGRGIPTAPHGAAREAAPCCGAVGHSALPEDDRASRLVRAWLHLETIAPLLATLESRGIPCLGFRGPFAAMDLYDDLAARDFADVDLLVPRTDRWSALAVAESLGFRIRMSDVTRGFLARNHLHWPLVHEKTGVLVDLHWAVDHPFRPIRVEYDAVFRQAENRMWEGFAWSQPCPRHLYLLTRLHAAKHGRTEEEEPDLGRIRMKYGAAMDWACVEAEAKAWHIEQAVSCAGEAPAWVERLARGAGFRAGRVADLRHYLVPDRAYFEPARGARLAAARAGHFLKASARVSLALADGLFFAARMGVKKWLFAAFAAVAVLSAQADCPVPDDHGDTPGVATTVAGTNLLTGAIGRDLDEDWFRFTALPGTVYSIRISTSTVWDATVALRAPDGETLLVLTNTASVSPVTALFTNGNTIATFYLEVGGYLQFTTGSYGLVVSPTNWTDTDADGLLDAWETNYFGSITNDAPGDVDGDGLSNVAEFYAGSDPTSASSGLVIAELTRTSGAARVSWQAGPYGTYRVLTATNLASPQVWTVLATNINLDASPLETFLDPASGATNRHYRVELMY